MAGQERKAQQMLACSIDGRQSCGKSPMWVVHLNHRLAQNLSAQINLGGSPARQTAWLERRQTSDPGSRNKNHGRAFELQSTQPEILSLLAGLQDMTSLLLCQPTLTFYAEIQQNDICCCNGQASASAKPGRHFH